MDITLDAVSSTLLIPLAARAQGGASFPWMACQDRQAAATLSELNVDVSIYLRDHATVLNILWRTQVLKQAGQDFFAHHPESLGVCLGCGLSDHFQWFDQGRNHWMDVDLPAVMATLWRAEDGGPGLGVSGSGDVKAGIVLGLCARGADPAQAAVWGAYLHGAIGGRLASRYGPYGYLSRELPAEIPQALLEVAR